jgi:toxin secretion/phage lysis holin
MIFAMVSLSAIIDWLIIGEGSALCSITILFYCSNELISICENANNMGIPLPQKLVSFLKEFQDKQQ